MMKSTKNYFLLSAMLCMLLTNQLFCQYDKKSPAQHCVTFLICFGINLGTVFYIGNDMKKTKIAQEQQMRKSLTEEIMLKTQSDCPPLQHKPSPTISEITSALHDNNKKNLTAPQPYSASYYYQQCALSPNVTSTTPWYSLPKNQN